LETSSEQPRLQDELAIVPTSECLLELCQAVQNSTHFLAIGNRLLEAEKKIIDGQDRYELPETGQYVLHDGILHLNNPITNGMRLVLASHDLQKRHLLATHTDAHHGYARKYEAMRPYYWPKMPQSIRLFLRHCPHCLRNKPTNHKLFGLLSLIPTPDEPFDTWSIDLVADLPACMMKNITIPYDTVMTVTDKYSTAVRFLLGRKDRSAANWAEAVSLCSSSLVLRPLAAPEAV
jgi:hypothetical protein